MKSSVSSLRILVFICVFSVLDGHPNRLPETIEATNENSSTCYGTLKQFQPSCTHRPGTVIGVQAVKVGAKRKSLGCPDNVPDDDPRNDTCCSRDSSTDCIQVFDYMKSAIPDKYKFHTLCSGYQECVKSAETVWAQSDCGNTTFEYMKHTNYMFMEFSCIEEERVGSLCADHTYIVSEAGSAFYLQTPEYPNRNISADIDKCTCQIQASSNIKVYTLDVRLYGQTLTIADSSTLDMYDETNATIFNITSTTMTDEVYITFTNTYSDTGAHVWIGLEAMNLSALTVNCKVYGVKDIQTTPSTSTTDTEPTNSVPKTESLLSPTPAGGFAVGIIIGIAIGLLCLIVIIVIPLCYFWKRKKRNTDLKKRTSNSIQNDKESEISRSTRKTFYSQSNPMNEKFKPSTVPSNKVEPTRFIEEHGGLKGNSVLPHIRRSSSRTAPDQRKEDMYLATRLPPLNSVKVEGIKAVDTETEQKRKRRSKKHRSHKRGHESSMKEARDPEKASVHSDDRNSCTDERRHSRKQRLRSYSNTKPPDDDNFVN